MSKNFSIEGWAGVIRGQAIPGDSFSGESLPAYIHRQFVVVGAELEALQTLLNKRDERIDQLEAVAERWEFMRALTANIEFQVAVEPILPSADDYPNNSEGIDMWVDGSIAAAKSAGIWPIAPKQCGACDGCTNGCRVDAESPEICKYPQMCSSACGCVDGVSPK